MEARLLRAALAAATLFFCGAGRDIQAQGIAPHAGGQPTSVRSQHFIVTAPSAELAREVCEAAEVFRRDLAIEWLGQELPAWRDICPIRVKLDPGAGGATSFVFHDGVPMQWTMQIQGTRERILDSVLPHEITHTIFATHFGGPLPRWADEGACTTVEHASEKAKQDRLLIRFLTTENRGIAFNKMFAMRDYPTDILPLYSQGYSVTRYLIQQGGKRKFVNYVGEGMRTNNWPATTKKFYGFDSLSELQVRWVAWVQQGSPDAGAASLASATTPPAAQPRTQMASLTQQPQSRIPEGALSSWQTPQAQNARALARADEVIVRAPDSSLVAPEQAALPVADSVSNVSRPVSDGWYARRRDEAQAVQQVTPPAPAQERDMRLIPSPPTSIPAQPASGPTSGGRKVLMEWSRPEGDRQASRDALTGVALR